MADKSTPTTAEIVILASGGVALIASFLDFQGEESAWGTFGFPIATLLPLYLVVMAVVVALTRFASVRLPTEVATLTWRQLHLALGFLAALMGLCWVIAAEDRGLGMWLLLLASFAGAAGAYMLSQEPEPGSAG